MGNVQQQEASDDAQILVEAIHAVDFFRTCCSPVAMTFFAISGYHTLFNASRHATLTRTLQDDGVHVVPIMRWLLPGGEFAGGAALVVGLLSVIAAFGCS